MVLSKGRTRTRPALQFCSPLGSPLKYGRGQILTFPPLSTSSKSYDVTRVHGFHTTNRPIGCGEMAVEDEKKWIDATLEIAYPPFQPCGWPTTRLVPKGRWTSRGGAGRVWARQRSRVPRPS